MSLVKSFCKLVLSPIRKKRGELFFIRAVGHKISYRQIQVGFPATEPLRKQSEITRCEYAKSKFSGRLS